MPVLRSGNVASPVNLKKTPTSSGNGCYEQAALVKTPDVLNQKTDSTTPSSILLGAGRELGSRSGGQSVSRSGSVWRRSLWLTEKGGLGLHSIGENVDHPSRKKKFVSKEDLCQLGNAESISDSDSKSNVIGMSVKRVRLTEEMDVDTRHSGDTEQFPCKGVNINVRGLQGSEVSTEQSGERSEREEKMQGKRTYIEVDFAEPNENERKFLNLRSGNGRSKRIMDQEISDLNVSESFFKDKQVVPDTDSEGEEKGNGKRAGTQVDFSGLNENERRLLNLRSGKRRPKRIMEEERTDLNASESPVKDKQVVVDADLSPAVLEQNLELGVGKVNEIGLETRGRFSSLDEVRENLVDNSNLSNGFDTLERRLENGDGATNGGVRTRNRRSKFDIGNEKVLDSDISEVIEVGVNTRSRQSRLDKGKVKLDDIDISKQIEVGAEMSSKRNLLDKGKVKMIELDDSIGYFGASGSTFEPHAPKTTACNVSDGASPTENVTVLENSNVPEERRSIRDRFRDLAKQNARRFAHFVAEEEDNTVTDGSLGNSSSEDEKMEDWPGPFSTAMKIIKDRETKKKMQQQSLSTGKSKASPLWVPKRDQEFNCRKISVPSLQDLCWPILVNNADAITSLDFIPDVLKHKLSQLLCDCRRMNCHILELLICGSPTEIRVRECSWLTEESFTRLFEQCDTSNLTVLQLDLCGCCLADYILYTTIACSPNSLPTLTTLSLKGAYRLSDVGLSTLATSAPSLRSINLSQCSLLTSDGIKCLADSLGPFLRELYISECQGIDAKLCLPALSKLQNLEVLAVASIETVNDSFVIQFVTARGHNLKELILKDCTKLTDSSVKAIAENCPKLCSIDLSNLHKLTDAALGYLANGRQAIHTLKLGRNLFSDEAVAAYIETCGDSLKEFSLNYVTQIADNTAVSLAKCSKFLQTLDLSFCRNMSNEDLGLIVDSCSSLRVLKLFGCSQVKDVFLCGHSNPHVQIIGLKMTSVFQHLNDPVLRQGLPCY